MEYVFIYAQGDSQFSPVFEKALISRIDKIKKNIVLNTEAAQYTFLQTLRIFYIWTLAHTSYVDAIIYFQIYSTQHNIISTFDSSLKCYAVLIKFDADVWIKEVWTQSFLHNTTRKNLHGVKSGKREDYVRKSTSSSKARPI